MGFAQYLKDTRSELNHVAWPTRVQTIVYTVLVVSVSILISFYLGFFDYAFTTGLGEIVKRLPPAQESPIIISTTTPDITIGTTTNE